MASVSQAPLSSQQQQLAAVQAAQAAAFHNGSDARGGSAAGAGSGAVAGSVAVPIRGVQSVSYEEVEDPPTRAMAYFHLLSHQFAVYMTFVLVALVIALGIAYKDSEALRDDVGNNVRRECKDVSDALLTYLALVVITGAFAVCTWLAYFVRQSARYLPVVCAFLFLASCAALAVWNVAGTVAWGKPLSTACRARGDPDATEVYNMVQATFIVIWVCVGAPVLVAGTYIFVQQVRDLAIEFPSERKKKEASRAERELLMAVPTNPARAFRYP